MKAKQLRDSSAFDAVARELLKTRSGEQAAALVFELEMLITRGNLKPTAARAEKQKLPWTKRKGLVLDHMREAADLLEDASDYLDDDLEVIGMPAGGATTDWFDRDKASLLTANASLLRSVLRLLADEFEKHPEPTSDPRRRTALRIEKGKAKSRERIPGSVDLGNVGKRGGAMNDEGAKRAWLIREIDARIPDSVPSRSRVIAELVSARFPDTSVQLVNSTLAALERHRGHKA